jgi:hypothetical protein
VPDPESLPEPESLPDPESLSLEPFLPPLSVDGSSSASPESAEVPEPDELPELATVDVVALLGGDFLSGVSDSAARTGDIATSATTPAARGIRKRRYM